MKPMYVDTAAWVSAADSTDNCGPTVRQTRDRWLSAGGVLVTTDSDRKMHDRRNRTGARNLLDTLKRIIGVYLIAVAVIVAVHTIIEPLYHSSTEANPYTANWSYINPLMAIAVTLSLVLSYGCKRRADLEGGRCSRHSLLFGSQHAVLRFHLRWNPVLLELVQPREPQLHRGGRRHGHAGLGLHRRRTAAASIGDGHVPAAVR